MRKLTSVASELSLLVFLFCVWLNVVAHVWFHPALCSLSVCTVWTQATVTRMLLTCEARSDFGPVHHRNYHSLLTFITLWLNISQKHTLASPHQQGLAQNVTTYSRVIPSCIIPVYDVLSHKSAKYWKEMKIRQGFSSRHINLAKWCRLSCWKF